MTPEARRDQLLAQEVGNEIVVYDERTHAAHRLNPAAALVWRLADGQRSAAQLASALHAALNTPDDEAIVRLALAELDKVDLLAKRMPLIGESLTRRDLLKVAGYLLPVVASIAVPEAQTCQTPGGHPIPGCSSSSSGSSSSPTAPTSLSADFTISAGASPLGTGLALIGATQVAFAATTSGGVAGATLSYAWDFGDSTAATGQNATHTYVSDPGQGSVNTVTVRLTVTPSSGSAATVTKTLQTRSLTGTWLSTDANQERTVIAQGGANFATLSGTNTVGTNLRPISGTVSSLRHANWQRGDVGQTTPTSCTEIQDVDANATITQLTGNIKECPAPGGAIVRAVTWNRQ